MSTELVVASHNPHKVVEFRDILVSTLPELTIVGYDGPEPTESGLTFAENALIKARAAFEHTGLLSLADDSGLCVDVLGGSPGIFSARWAGSHGDSESNVRLLLDQLADIDVAGRAAHFMATIALVWPDGSEDVVEGTWSGRIGAEARGINGFGYDPIFIPDGLDVSAAELLPSEKNAMSHRARAFEALLPLLKRGLASSPDAT